jgi:hypothetical protein
LKKKEIMATSTQTEKPFNHLKGIIFGIGSDGTIDRAEFNELKLWCQAHQGLCEIAPFDEFFSEIKSILDVGVMTSEEIFEMNQLIKKYQPLLSPDQSPDAELHFLQGICYGILADDEINKYELDMLKGWLKNEISLTTKEPFKGMLELITKVMLNNHVSNEEYKELKVYFEKVIAMD